MSRAASLSARAVGALAGSLEALRSLIARTHELVTYEPVSPRMVP